MKKKVAFICVHNSCRSQMAEALGKIFGGDVFESYSAGTETIYVNFYYALLYILQFSFY